MTLAFAVFYTRPGEYSFHITPGGIAFTSPKLWTKWEHGCLRIGMSGKMLCGP